MLDQLAWPLDYLSKCIRSDKEIIAQVGDGKQDHSQWVSTTYWDNRKRKTFKISKGSDLGAEMAAALASSYIIYKDVNSDFAKNLLDKAKLAFKFAERSKTPYHQAIPQASEFYKSWSGYKDELCWGAAWLYAVKKSKIYKKYKTKTLSVLDICLQFTV